MLQPPSLQHLVPDSHPLPNGNTLYSFVNPNIELVKLDITLEAGSAYQQKKSLAHAANQLFGEATARHTASEIAEFLDFRGIVVERLSDVCVSNISFYFHRKYAAELFPVIREMFDNPVITPEMFEAYKSHRRQQIEMGFQQTNFTARNLFYECLYGFDHPLGTYAKASDLDLLTIDDVSSFRPLISSSADKWMTGFSGWPTIIFLHRSPFKPTLQWYCPILSTTALTSRPIILSPKPFSPLSA